MKIWVAARLLVSGYLANTMSYGWIGIAFVLALTWWFRRGHGMILPAAVVALLFAILLYSVSNTLVVGALTPSPA